MWEQYDLYENIIVCMPHKKWEKLLNDRNVAKKYFENKSSVPQVENIDLEIFSSEIIFHHVFQLYFALQYKVVHVCFLKRFRFSNRKTENFPNVSTEFKW